MCRQLEISRAAYYKWIQRDIPEQEQENEKLAGLIRSMTNVWSHLRLSEDGRLDQLFQSYQLQTEKSPPDYEEVECTCLDQTEKEEI